jgi:hypothetical protein
VTLISSLIILALHNSINNSIVLKIKRYVRDDWGVPFIAGFIVLLLVAAILLSAGWATMAELVADVAYFALVAGVILQIICFTRVKGWVIRSVRIISNCLYQLGRWTYISLKKMIKMRVTVHGSD